MEGLIWGRLGPKPCARFLSIALRDASFRISVDVKILAPSSADMNVQPTLRAWE
jgi:hypothetical protein